MNLVKIYQLEKTATKYFFRGFDYAKTHGFTLSDYKIVYTCKRPDDYSQDSAFDEFNCRHPADYKAHSLSVSDIVEINGKRWYCDSFGWVVLN